MFKEENRRLPRYEPTEPPRTAAIANGKAKNGSCLVLVMLPSKPEIELARMKSAETAEAVLVLAQRIRITKGVKKIPPPTPVNPESRPSPAPTETETGLVGECGSSSGFGRIKNRAAE